MKSLFSFTLAAALAAQACLAQALPARAAARFLDQATWGPTPASITYLQNVGIENWLAIQFAMNRSDLPDRRFSTRLDNRTTISGRCKRRFFKTRSPARISFANGWRLS